VVLVVGTTDLAAECNSRDDPLRHQGLNRAGTTFRKLPEEQKSAERS
jgi:hypothetical protein